MYSTKGVNFVSVYYLLLVLFIQVKCHKAEDDKDDNCGKESQNKFPWNIGVFIENGNVLELLCFGSIIKANAVLTAAHCVSTYFNGELKKNKFFVSANRIEEEIKDTSHNLTEVEKIILSKQYRGADSFMVEDIAILKIANLRNEKIQAVCIDWSQTIPTNDDDKLIQPAWDKSKVENVEQTFLDYDDCKYYAPKSFQQFITLDKQCLESKSKQNHEDEGSGIVFKSSENRRFYLKGVLSQHEDSKRKISTFTPIKMYLNWISSIIATF